MLSARYRKISEENKKFEQESPYNFCDRWCERCLHKKQITCRLYLDDLECKVTCIAHGKEEDDSEVTEAVMEAQYSGIEEAIEKSAEKFGIDPEALDFEGTDEEDDVDPENLPKEIHGHIKFVKNHPLPVTVDQYRLRANAFLKENFYEKETVALVQETGYHFATLSWYHTLLPVKLQRALAGLHEPVREGDFGLYDAVAQLLICKKAVFESTKAFRAISPHYLHHQKTIIELMALLHNIFDRITALEESI